MPSLEYRPALVRWLALLVRYWSRNMDLVDRRGGYAPGFGYTEQEKAHMHELAARISLGEFSVWLVLCAVLFILILVLLVMLAAFSVTMGFGPVHDLPNLAAAPFFLGLGLVALASLAIGLPLAMLPAAALTGRLFRVADSDLPDNALTAHFFHKLWFQITRIALIVVIALVPLWLLLPGDSDIMLIVRLVASLLGPAVASLTMAYTLAARLR